MYKLYYDKKTSILLFCIFLIINYFQPLIIDDLCYSVKAVLYNHTIFSQLVFDYYNWTGRMSSWFISYIFFNQPYQLYLNTIFNLLNAFFMVDFINTVFNIIVKNDDSKKNYANYLSFIFVFFLLLLLSKFFINTLWKVVGIQYFWGIWLLTRVFFDQFYSIKPVINNKIMLLVLGIFIGLYNEIFSVIVAIFVFAYLFHQIFNQVKINKNILAFLLGDILGGICLIAAPGNHVRQVTGSNNHIFTISEQIHYLIHSYLHHTLFLIILCLVILVILLDKQKLKNQKLIIIGALFAMLLVPLPVANFTLSHRMLMLQYISLSIILFQYLLSFNSILLLIKNTSLGLLVILNMMLFSIPLISYYNLFTFNQNRYLQINNYLTNNKSLSVYKLNSYKPRIKLLAKLVYFDDVQVDSHDWKNVCFAKYYKLNSVELIK
jgi:hypothetical protein